MSPNLHRNSCVSAFLMAPVFPVLLRLPEVGFAQTAAEAKKSVSGFMNNLTSLLNIASIAIVTIAVIFAGYGIAFAHKRLSEVAPVLIGGFLIGAAGQLAKMLIGDKVGVDTTGMVMAVLQNYA